MSFNKLKYHNFDIKACLLTLNVITKNYLDRSTGSGTFHRSQIGGVGSLAHQTSDSLQNLCLGLYTNSKYDYQKLS